MARTPQNVTDAEWAILDVLWNQGPATVRHLTEVLYPSGSASEHGTVYKLLERLEAKGCVKRARSGGVYEFRATVARDEVIGRELEALVEKMCGGSLQPWSAQPNGVPPCLSSLTLTAGRRVKSNLTASTCAAYAAQCRPVDPSRLSFASTSKPV